MWNAGRWWIVQGAACGLMLAACCKSAIANATESTAPDTCSLQPGPTRTVTRIIDGETVALDDGREVRLIGALAPRARDAGADAGAWPLEEAAKTALADLTLGKRVELAFGAIREDRYGRHLAHLFTREGSARLWIQGEMLQLGLARAYVLPGDDTCLAELIANEAIARTAEAGLWTSHLYTPRQAEKTAALMSLRATFQIISGKVASVGRTANSVYLDFGDDWHTDFTVSIPKRVFGGDGAFNSRLDTLKGQTIEVRGWIERRNGPLIAIISPAQISILDDEAPASSPSAGVEPSAEAQTGSVNAATPSQQAAAPKGRPHKHNRPRRKAPGDVDL